jgi:glyoxalase/bleomycin resistance protein/dioxygenase superfamily protein
MKPVITELVTRYESGRMSRRDLIQGLTMLVAAASAKGADSAPEATQLNCTGVDHVSVRVKDLKRSAEFYQSLFGLEPRGEDKAHRILRLGKDRRVIVSLRQDEPYGQIDHFGLKIEGFNKDAATKLLTTRGLTPKEDWEYGYYVRDPDNAVVQML